MRPALILLVIIGALALSTCGNDTHEPTPVTTTTTTTTTTLPPPTTTLAAKTCTLSPMPDCGSHCCREGGEPQFDAEIVAAQEALRRDKPDWFRPNGSIKVTDVEYTWGVAEKVTELFGLCARGGSKYHREHSMSPDEVGIKRNNNLSQNVDIIIGGSQMPNIGERFTCKPASF